MMTMIGSLRQNVESMMAQIRQQWRLLAIVYITLIIFLLILTFQRLVPLHELTADTASLVDVPVYLGMLSNIGIVIWGTAFAVCVFAAATLWRRSEWMRFFIGAAAFTLALMLDDMFMIHDRILPDMGISEMVYVLFYAVAALAFTVGLWGFLKKTDYALLLIAVALLGSSVVFDVSGGFFRRLSHAAYGEELEDEDAVGSVSIEDHSDDTSALSETPAPAVTQTGIIPRGNISALAEDGTKFLGIAGWMLYFAVTARKRILACFGQTASSVQI
jgi:hypothetical protein